MGLKDTGKADDDNVNVDAVFFQEPTPLDQHPVNYLVYMGGLLRRYRRGLKNKEHRSATGFGEKLSEYLGKSIERRTISRAEKGDHTVGWGVIAAYLCEMNAWPDIIGALEDSDTNNLRYLILVEKEIEDDIQRSRDEGLRVLRKKSEKGK